MDDGRGRLTGKEREALREIGAALEGQDPRLAKLFHRQFGSGRWRDRAGRPLLARISVNGYLALGTALVVAALLIRDLVTLVTAAVCFFGAFARHQAGSASPAPVPPHRNDDRQAGL